MPTFEMTPGFKPFTVLYVLFFCLFVYFSIIFHSVVSSTNSLTLYLCDQKFALGVIGTSLDKYKNKVCKNGPEKQPIISIS